MTASNAIDPARPDESAAAERRAITIAVAWVVGAALVRALLSSLVPLLPDETYYWLWTRHLDAGYFDHPPGIALLIALGTSVFGDTHAGVRAGPMLAAVLTHAAASAAAWQLGGRGTHGAIAAARAAAIVAVVPLATLGLVIATPDAALFATVMVARVAVERALAAPVRSARGFGWWTLAGVALGGAFVAKYTAVLLPAGLVVACIVHPALRARFREAGPWWASLIALSVFAPVVLWNSRHEWLSFRFQLGHGFGATVRGSVLSRELELLGGQVGLASPILFALMAIAVWIALRDGWRTRFVAAPADVSVRRFAFAVTAVVPLIVFMLSATRRSVEANWPALMYPAAMLLLATDSHRVSHGRWWRGGVTLAMTLIAVVAVQAWRPLLPLAPRKDPMARAHGWDTLAAAVEAARQDPFFDGTTRRWVAADRYQDASEMAFHLADHPPVFSLNLGGRANQFDLWPTVYDNVRPGDAMIAVFDDNPAGDSLGVRVGRWFNTSQPGARVVLRRGKGEVAHRRVWLYRDAAAIPARPRDLPALSGER